MLGILANPSFISLFIRILFGNTQKEVAFIDLLLTLQKVLIAGKGGFAPTLFANSDYTKSLS